MKPITCSIFPILIALYLIGCKTVEVQPEKTSLEIQAIQAKQFETTQNVAFSSTLSVFQDLGYIVKSADRETGFITAQSASRSKKESNQRLKIGDFQFNLADLLDDSSDSKKTTRSYTSATAFIEELRPHSTQIRLNFVVSRLSSSRQGQSEQRDTIVEDPKIYQNAFNKIGDAIFIRQQ